ncbi:MAG: hypothetical protein ACI97A_001737 [Planctomycetota bacterium]|jgi:hypothetical protein
MNRSVLFGIAIFLVVIVSVAGWMIGVSEDAQLSEFEIAEQGEVDRRTPERNARIPETNQDDNSAAEPEDSQLPPSVITHIRSTEGLTEENTTAVLVVGVNGKEPGAGCILSVVDAEKMNVVAQEAAGDLVSFLKNHGVHYRVPDNGELRIHRLDHDVLVGAFNGLAFAFDQWRPDQTKKLELRLQVMTEVAVRILDHDGNPVANSAAVLGRRRDPSHRGHGRIFAVKKVDGNGVAKLNLLDQVIEAASEELPLYSGVRGLLVPPLRREFDAKNPPKDVVEFRVPESGSMTVKILDTDGKVMESQVSLSITRTSGAGLSKGETIQTSKPSYSEIVNHGTTKIPFVTCGLSLDFEVYGRRGQVVKPLRETYRGPNSPDEERIVILQFKEKWPLLTARILNEEGRPLQNEEISVLISFLKGGGSSSNTLQGKTNADGVIELPLMKEVKADLTSVMAKFSTKATKASVGRSAEYSLPLDSLLLDVVDAGDLIVAESPLLVSGTVVDVDGNPIPKARVTPISTSDSWQEQRKFKAQIEFNTKTNEKGEFLIRGTTNQPEFRLQVSAKEYLRQTQLSSRGSEGVRVILTPAGFITGRIVANASLRMDDIYVMVSEEGDNIWRGNQPQTDGTFKSEPLQPGRYDVHFSLDGHDREPIRTIAGLEVLAAQTVDVGEVEVELKGMKIELVLTEPAPTRRPQRIRIKAVRPGTNDLLATATMFRPKKTLIVSEARCDLICNLDGYRELRLNNVQAGKVEIKFKSGIPVGFEITNKKIIPEGMTVRFSPYLANSPITSLRGGMSRKGQPTSVPAAGTYKIRCMLGTSSNGRNSFSEIQVTPSAIKVDDSDLEQVFQITLDADSVKEVSDRIKK